MENVYRKHIEKNVRRLMLLTDYSSLREACMASKLLSPTMIQNIEKVDPSSPELNPEELKQLFHERLLLKITKRGPKAYQHLKMLLSMLKCDQAVQLLNEPRVKDAHYVSIIGERLLPPERFHFFNQREYNKTDKTYDELPILEEYTGKTKPIKTHKVMKSVRIQRDTVPECYPMRTREKRGIFMLFNITDFPNKEERRNGAEEDKESLLYLFKELGFKVFYYSNSTKEQFFQLLDQMIVSEYTRGAECFVMALLTHGNMEGSIEKVQFHDGSVVKVTDILERFDNNKCPNLIDRPKIFIFPFCRGTNVDKGHYSMGMVQTDHMANRALPTPSAIATASDILICYAASPGFKAHRDTKYGSWYIQVFCKQMAAHAHDTCFEDIVKVIQREASALRTESGGLQMGNYANLGFNRKLFFNPGIWEDEEKT